MTHTEPSGAVAEALRSPCPTIAIDLENMAILGANEAAYKILGRPLHSLEGAPPTDIVSVPDRPAVEPLLHMLSSGAIEGYRAVRRFAGGDGTEFTANITVHLSTTNGARFGLVVLEDSATPAPWRVLDAGTHIALAMTDHDWIIEHISSDIEQILGQGPETYKGTPLLGLLRPSAVENFMTAVGRIASGGDGATLRLTMRAASDRWVDVWCLVVPMCRHSPPRLGLVISSVTAQDATLPPELHQQLGALCDDAFGAMDDLQSRSLSAPFSTRQWEILTRLARGERVKDIATALYLSPSTVRNHLTAIYRKFGVHSQAELLATLLNAPA